MKPSHPTTTLALALVLFIGLTGCTSPEFNCATDAQTIQDVAKAFVVVVPRSEVTASSQWDEQKYQIISVLDEATAYDVPVHLMAESHERALFCSVACAEQERDRKNTEVDQRIRERAEGHLHDSLVLDSINRGLIR